MTATPTYEHKAQHASMPMTGIAAENVDGRTFTLRIQWHANQYQEQWNTFVFFHDQFSLWHPGFKSSNHRRKKRNILQLTIICGQDQYFVSMNASK